MITVQYLEDAPDLAELKITEVVDIIRAAAARLPITHLLIGWHLPESLLEACRKEAEQLGIKFLRWHPLLTGDAVFQPRLEWQVIGASGHPIPGFRGIPEFTFVCPNHPAVQEAIFRHVEDLLKEGLYQGFFLDRVRFPSPSAHPLNDLGCFCEHCRRQAHSNGLELDIIQRLLLNLDASAQGRLSLIQILLNCAAPALSLEIADILHTYRSFRSRGVTDLVAMLSVMLRQAGMEIGLDCFSPSLANMVGQDLGALSIWADWIKVMSYAHVRGPAGLPFELLGMLEYLCEANDSDPANLLFNMGDAFALKLTDAREIIEKDGIPPSALEKELRHVVDLSSVPILAGFELVEIPGVAELSKPQVLRDLEAVRRSGVAGLSISWDLRKIPLERLDWVHQGYLVNQARSFPG